MFISDTNIPCAICGHDGVEHGDSNGGYDFSCKLQECVCGGYKF